MSSLRGRPGFAGACGQLCFCGPEQTRWSHDLCSRDTSHPPPRPLASRHGSNYGYTVCRSRQFLGRMHNGRRSSRSLFVIFSISFSVHMAWTGHARCYFVSGGTRAALFAFIFNSLAGRQSVLNSRKGRDVVGGLVRSGVGEKKGLSTFVLWKDSDWQSTYAARLRTPSPSQRRGRWTPPFASSLTFCPPLILICANADPFNA
jgi:hypothetical protein